MTRRGPTPMQEPAGGAFEPRPSRVSLDRSAGAPPDRAGPASCGSAPRSGAALQDATPRPAAWRFSGPGLATLALLLPAMPPVHGQPASAASAVEPAHAAPPASAASRGRSMPPAFRGGSQSEAMQACRSLPGEQAQHECMLRHQSMPPYGEGAASVGPAGRRP